MELFATEQNASARTVTASHQIFAAAFEVGLVLTVGRLTVEVAVRTEVLASELIAANVQLIGRDRNARFQPALSVLTDIVRPLMLVPVAQDGTERIATEPTRSHRNVSMVSLAFLVTVSV